MAINKGNQKNKRKKGGKKKIIDPFAKKDWYDIKAPAPFQNRYVGKTPVTKTIGKKIASEQLKGRVFEVSLADLNSDEDLAWRKMKIQCQDVSDRNVLCNFYGMDFTTDKLKSLVRKWQTLIEAYVDVKTTDGYVLRMFCIGFTKRRQNQIRKTSYAQSSQIRQIRKKMVDIMSREATSCELKDLVHKFIPNGIGKQIEKECQGIYPLSNVFIRKVKILKAPKFDSYKLMELHSEAPAAAAPPADTGAKVDRPEETAEA